MEKNLDQERFVLEQANKKSKTKGVLYQSAGVDLGLHGLRVTISSVQDLEWRVLRVIPRQQRWCAGKNAVKIKTCAKLLLSTVE